MSLFIGFGSGVNGALTISSNTTEAPIDSGCSGSSGSTSLSATNASFAAGQIIYVHQSRGLNAGLSEFNQISSYSAGTITTTSALSNTYTDSGSSQAQVRVVPQYSAITIASGATYSVKGWDGNVGGIFVVLCNGPITIAGTLSVNGASGSISNSINGAGGGYRGGAGDNGGDNLAQQGESEVGVGTASSANNGSGGGTGYAATGGAVYMTDATFATKFVFGGGGGGAEASGTGATGGNGAGLIFLVYKSLTVTGAITANGGAGTESISSDSGGGAGGAIFLKGINSVLGSSLITASAGSSTKVGQGAPGAGGAGGSIGNNSSTTSGDGGAGIIRVESCTLSGATTPSATQVVGGHSFCGSLTAII